jgi:hypothetical protein
MPAIPYTTKTGLQIGKYYEKPRYIEMDDDMLVLQTYLIYDPALIRKHKLIKLAYSITLISVLGYLLIIT